MSLYVPVTDTRARARARARTARRALLALATALALTSAGAQPQPALPTVKLTAGVHLITAEVARDDASRMRGLMFRTSLPPNGGMLFIRQQDRRHPAVGVPAEPGAPHACKAPGLRPAASPSGRAPGPINGATSAPGDGHRASLRHLRRNCARQSPS